MNRLLAASMCGLSVLALAGCTDDTAALPPPAEDVVTASSSDAGTRPPVQPALSGAVRLELSAEGLEDDPRVQALERYVVARQQSLRAGSVTPALADAATYTWLVQQRDTIAVAAQRGWTVPARPVGTVPALRVEGAEAQLQLCLWEPSVAFVRRSSGQPASATEPTWTPVDVRMVQVDGRWQVNGAALDSHACTGG